MTTELVGDAQLEIGHVLIMDIVGFSKLLVDQQSEIARRLNQVVRDSDQFRAAEAADKLFRLPTGDGMILAFFNSPEAPVRCAVEIARALKKYPEMGLRMGVHSGPVHKISDVNDRSNLAGTGVNVAQRVMDCGDAGHILLSRRAAEDLEQHSKWKPHLQDLGECEVKHGLRVDVVNLWTGEVGNPVPPAKFAAAAVAAAAKTSAANRALLVRRRRIIFLAGFVLALFVLAIGLWQSAQRKSAVAKGISSLAVKPLDNFSGDPSKNYFADGMTEELTTKLSEIGALKTVISRSTMMKYKGSSKSPSEIAHEVKVGAIVAGSVMLSGIELIDAASETVLLRREYPRQVANIVQLQNEVAMAVANAIALKLTPGEKARLASGRLVIPQAYDYYLRAKGGEDASREGVDSRIELLEKAVSLDDTFAEAFADLSSAYVEKGYFFDAANKQEWDIKAEEMVGKALRLNPDLPAAHLAQAYLLWNPSTGFQHEKAIAEIRRVLSLAPNFGEARSQLGAIYFHVGLLKEAMQEFKRADQIIPDNPGIKFHFGLLALLEGRYDQAVPILEANLNGMLRGFAEYNLASALFNSGRADEARARIDKARAETNDEGGILTATQALFLAASGDKKRAHEKIDEAVKIGRGFGHFHHTTYAIASAYALMDEPEPAMKWLNYTAENGYPNLTWFERDPNLDKLRKDPRFIEFLDMLRPRFERLKALSQTDITSSK
jgi:TolB-like protein/class 3 adenylate cyclase/Flp pilus assembly protein TadD